MIREDIAKKIRHITITTRRLLSSSLAGDSRSALKGFGFDFDQIREYSPGDDVRFIDWKSSSRMNKFLVKQYIQERNRTIYLAVDVSSSSFYSSAVELRSEYMAHIASVLALVADFGKDAVGLMLFSDTVELFIPPLAGHRHIHMIMERLLTFKPLGTGTNIAGALTYLTKRKSGKGLVFMLSDFIDDDFDKALRIASKKHDFVAIRCLDNREKELPDCGFVTVCDSETGQEFELDTRKNKYKNVHSYLKQRIEEQNILFRRCGIDCFSFQIGKPFIKDLITYFRRRMVY